MDDEDWHMIPSTRQHPYDFVPCKQIIEKQPLVIVHQQQPVIMKRTETIAAMATNQTVCSFKWHAIPTLCGCVPTFFLT